MSERNRAEIVVGVTGASGALYAVRFLKLCLETGLTVDLICSAYGKRLLIEECGYNPKADDLGAWLDARYGPAERPGTLRIHGERDLGATVASGSQRRAGMAIVPCSMKTLAGVAQGLASNLIERAADVTLKEGRPLVLVPRETPLNLIQIENMARAARAGAAIVPAMPAFYSQPKTFEDLADFLATRILQRLGIDHAPLVPPWPG